MKDEWKKLVDQAEAGYGDHLGRGDPVIRCMARYGLAMSRTMNEWYSDECERGTEPAVLLKTIGRMFGQMVAVAVHNSGGNPALIDAVAGLVASEAEKILPHCAKRAAEMRAQS